MLFNSFEFAVFLPLVFLVYWFVTNRSLKLQNLFVMLVSYLFYGWWDYRFLALIVFSSIVDYIVGIRLSQADGLKTRKILLAVSMSVNLGLLGFFKYYNFFIDSFINSFAFFGVHLDTYSLQIILPVGISFYTFQTMSYTIDIYKRQLEPTKDVIAFFAFVSFFPQLVAGPIERASNLLPQFLEKRKFDYGKAKDGVRQILWGFFKKVVIADVAAAKVNYIFSNYEELNSGMLILGALYFAFQIYGDFSGYSDIAIGTARLFGFDLMRNFAYPYFSRDIAEFWRRWHISLSTWFRDYLYIPLGGNRGGMIKKVTNVMIVFTVSGFWHGANWTFVFWGFLNGLYFLPLMLLNLNRTNTDSILRMLPSVKEFAQMGITFILTCIAWVFFRAEDIGQAFGYLGAVVNPGNFGVPGQMKSHVGWILLLLLIEWVQRHKLHPLDMPKMPVALRWTIYLIFVGVISYYTTDTEIEFIYFQF